MNLLKSTSIIGGMTLISRLFGFIRDAMIARLLGAGAVADAWQMAFQMPNIFRGLFAEGAFSAAFVPLFNQKMAGESGHNAAQKFAIEILSVLVPILLLFSAIMAIAMPGAIWLLDDFGRGGRTNDFTINLARITFPYLVLISAATLFSAILNSVSKFTAAAAAPIFMNIFMIAAMLISLYPDGGENLAKTAYFLAFSLSLSGLFQMLWLFHWARKSGFRLRLHRPRWTADVRGLGRLIGPAIFGAGIYQISRFVDLFFLGQLPQGSFTFLGLADRLNQLPLGIIGIALGTAILPALSRFIAKGDAGGAQNVQNNAIEIGLFLTVPAAVGLYFAATPLITAIYFGGRFDLSAAVQTGAVLSMLVIGLPAYVMVKILTPGFFARKDTRTPVYTAGIALLINITLNILLIPLWGVPGLALAGATAAWCNCFMLYFMLNRRGHLTIAPALLMRIARIFLSAAIMGAVIYIAQPYGARYYPGSAAERVISIMLLCLLGAISYFGLAWLTGAIDKSKIAMLRRGQTE